MKRALVTGGSRGLGLAICRRLLETGWAVITAARHCPPELRTLLDAHPSDLAFIETDLADSGSVANLVNHARILDGLDAYVANAGVGFESLLSLTSEAAIRSCVELNLVSPMLLAREVIKGMLAAGRPGSLVFISSVAARTGISGLSVYGATKAGLIAFARALAREYGERGIRANCVLPGFLETDMTSSLNTEQRQRVIRRTAVKKLGTVGDVVGTVGFLLSDDAQYLSGAEIVVDGGMTA